MSEVGGGRRGFSCWWHALLCGAWLMVAFGSAVRADEPSDSGQVKTRGEGIVLPKVEFKEATFSEALQYLHARTRSLASDHVGVNFIAPTELRRGVRVTFERTNVTIREVAGLLAKEANCTLRAEPQAFVFQAIGKPARPWIWADADDASRQVEARLHAVKLAEFKVSMRAHGALLSLIRNAKDLAGKDAPEMFSRIWGEEAGVREVNLHLQQVSLYQALRYLCLAGGLHARISKDGVDVYDNEESFIRQMDEWSKDFRDRMKAAEAKPHEEPADIPGLAGVEPKRKTFPELNEKAIALFLERRGETAENFRAVFAVTSGNKWLEKGLEKFPADPELLLLWCEQQDKFEDKLEMVKRVRQANPNHLWPVMIDALIASHPKVANEAMLKTLEQALRNPALRLEYAPNADAVLQLFSDCGEEPHEAAWFAPVWRKRLPLMVPIKLTRAITGQEDLLPQKNPQPLSAAALSCLLALEERLAAVPARNGIEELVTLVTETKALEGMTPETTPKGLKKAPAERLKEIEERKTRIRKMGELNLDWFEPSLMPELLKEALRRYHAEGELAAYEWLAGQRPAGIK